MNNLQIFENKEIGQVRTVTIDGVIWFVALDVSKILGYDQVSNLLKRLDTDEYIKIAPSILDCTMSTMARTISVINESGLFSAILGSQMPNAKTFKKWVTSEILPSIRKSGTYTVDKRLSEKEMLRIQLNMIDEVEQRVENLENNMVIDYGQQQVLKNVVNATVTTSLGGKASPAYKEISKIVFSECNKDFQNYFKVNSRNNTPKIKFDEAINYVSEWQPCTNTKLLINICNAQLTIAV